MLSIFANTFITAARQDVPPQVRVAEPRDNPLRRIRTGSLTLPARTARTAR